MELIDIICNKKLLLKEFLENKIALNCKTIEDARYLFSNIKDLSEKRKKDFINYWYTYREETCYEHYGNNYYFCSLKYFREQEPKEIKEWKK